MVEENGAWTRQSEAFWRAHHEAWKRSDLNQRRYPFTGHLFVFCGRTRANLIKIIYWDGTGFCLFTNGSNTASFSGHRASSRRKRCL
jgi:hypothetical protein